VRKASADAEITLSVCTGAFILAETGLLDGKKATTHWGAIEALKKKYPKVTVCTDQRFVDNGKVITSAGVAAGIDASLHVVEKMLGKEAADQAARDMEYRRSAPPGEK
jgi:transcriptional regulator GlxA family with amidase domain